MAKDRTSDTKRRVEKARKGPPPVARDAIPTDVILDAHRRGGYGWKTKLAKAYKVSTKTMQRLLHDMGLEDPPKKPREQLPTAQKQHGGKARDRVQTDLPEGMVSAEESAAEVLKEVEDKIGEAANITKEVKKFPVSEYATALMEMAREVESLDVIINLRRAAGISTAALGLISTKVAAGEERGFYVSSTEVRLLMGLADQFRTLGKEVFEIEAEVHKLAKESVHDLFIKEMLNAVHEVEPAVAKRVFDAINARSVLLGALVDFGAGEVSAAGRDRIIEAEVSERPTAGPL